MKIIKYIPFIIALTFTACQRQPTADFRFKNETEENIWVDGVQGLKFGLACGYLGGNGTATNVMLPVNDLPQYCEIIWTTYNEKGEIEEDQIMTKSNVDLSHLPEHLDRGVITFHFTSPKVWTASFTKKESNQAGDDNSE